MGTELRVRISPYIDDQLKIITKVVGLNRSELVRMSLLYFLMNFDEQVKKDLKNLVKTFAGDSAIAVDLLNNALDYYQYNNPLILEIIKKCQSHPESYNLDFILSSITYLEKVKKIPTAIKLIKKSKFYSKREKQHIEMFYQLGLLYFKKQKLKLLLFSY